MISKAYEDSDSVRNKPRMNWKLCPVKTSLRSLNGISAYKKSPKPGHSLWRRGRDSNSGRGRPLDGFQDRCIKPLCHLSIKIHNIEDILKTVIKLRFIDDLRLIAGGSALRQSSLCCDSKTAALNHSATSPQDSFAVNRNLLLKTKPKVKHFLYN